MWPTSRKGIIAMNRKTRNLLALQAFLEDHWPMIWDLGQNYDEKSNWQKYIDAVEYFCYVVNWRWESCEILDVTLTRVRCQEKLSTAHFIPQDWETQLNLCISFYYSVLPFGHGACFQPSKPEGKSQDEMRMVGLSYVFLYSCNSHDIFFFSIKMICLRPLGILISNHLSFNLPSGHAIRFFVCRTLALLGQISFIGCHD